MQIFVNRNDLINDPVVVLAFHPDLPPMAIDAYGATATNLTLPPTDLDSTVTPPVLVSNFRNDMAIMVGAEAGRRILAVFSDEMQRNANADINRSTMLYGADYTTWPTDAVTRKSEGDRGWQYISAIRQTSDALSVQTTLTDPTDDSHWPTPISPPVYIEPTP